MRNGQLTATEWLTLVSIKSESADARRLARYGLDQWKEMGAAWKAEGVRTRRSLWDLLAGVVNVHKNNTHHVSMSEVRTCGKVFYFPVFVEACGRRAKSYKGTGAIRAGVPVNSERLPQTTKWGNKVCKT